MPNRVIRDGINDSERVNALGFEAEVFYRRLFAIADDFGYFEADPVLLRSKLYTRLVDKITIEDIRAWLKKSYDVKLIDLYSLNGKTYGQVLNFGQQLRIMRSKIPNQHGRFTTKQEYLQENNLLPVYTHKTEQPETKHIVTGQPTEPLKTAKLTDIFLKDLPGSSNFETMCMRLKVEKETLATFIPAFEKAMSITYKSFDDFCDHFKNWYLKNKDKVQSRKGPNRKQF